MMQNGEWSVLVLPRLAEQSILACCSLHQMPKSGGTSASAFVTSRGLLSVHEVVLSRNKDTHQNTHNCPQQRRGDTNAPSPTEPSLIVRCNLPPHSQAFLPHLCPRLVLRPEGPCNKIDCMSEREKGKGVENDDLGHTFLIRNDSNPYRTLDRERPTLPIYNQKFEGCLPEPKDCRSWLEGRGRFWDISIRPSADTFLLSISSLAFITL